MAIGDINSNERGSAARYNDDKAPTELYPVRMLAAWAKEYLGPDPDVRGAEIVVPLLQVLARFQEREVGPRVALNSALGLLKPEYLLDGARVFGYGAKKYAAWNWAKGMPWSVPLACAVRHLLAIVSGEPDDPESGLPHIGHVVCNLTMLWVYAQHYPEGDDLPPRGALTCGETRELS